MKRSKSKILLDPTKEYTEKMAQEARKCEGTLDKMLLINNWCRGYTITAEQAQEKVDEIILNAVKL